MGESEDEFRKVLDESIKINKYAINLEKLNKSLDKLRNSGFNDLEICRLKGFVYLELMDYKNSFDEYKKALSLLENGGDFDDISIHKQKTLIGGDGASDIKYIEKSKDILKAWIHHGFAVVSTVMKKYSDAEKHFGIAKGLFWDAGDDGLAARVLNDMGWLYDEQKDYDKALHQYEEAIRNSSNSLTLAYSNLYRGTALYNCDNRDKRAYEAFKEANRHLKDARTLKESNIYSNKILECDLLEAKISTNMARLILKSGTELNIDIDDGKKLLDSALELYNNNLEHIDAIFSNRLNMVEKDNLAVIHNLLGKYYFIKDDKTLAEEEFSNAKKYSKSLKSKAMSINNLACSKYKNEKFKDSIEYFFEAIKKDPDIDVIIRTNMDAILNPAKGGCDLFGFWIGDLIKNGIFSRSIFKTVLAASVIILMILNIFIIMFPSYIHSGDTFDGIHYVENTTESTYSVSSEEIGLKKAQTNNAGDKEFKNDQLILSAKKVTEKVSINLEYRMILVGIGIIIILLPWIKSFKAGNLEIEIKDSLSIVTGGAGDPKALLIEA